MTKHERFERVERRDVNPLGTALIAWSFVGLLVLVAVFLWLTYSKRLLEWRELSSRGSIADFPEPRLIMPSAPAPESARGTPHD